METEGRRPSEAMFNLCKMLVIPVLFAALLYSGVSVISRVRHPRGASSPRNACIANMKQLEGAKFIWELEERRQTNDVPTWSDVIGKNKCLARKPTCPSEGTYTLGTVGRPTTCSVPGDVRP